MKKHLAQRRKAARKQDFPSQQLNSNPFSLRVWLHLGGNAHALQDRSTNADIPCKTAGDSESTGICNVDGGLLVLTKEPLLPDWKNVEFKHSKYM